MGYFYRRRGTFSVLHAALTRQQLKDRNQQAPWESKQLSSLTGLFSFWVYERARFSGSLCPLGEWLFAYTREREKGVYCRIILTIQLLARVGDTDVIITRNKQGLSGG